MLSSSGSRPFARALLLRSKSRMASIAKQQTPQYDALRAFSSCFDSSAPWRRRQEFHKKRSQLLYTPSSSRGGALPSIDSRFLSSTSAPSDPSAKEENERDHHGSSSKNKDRKRWQRSLRNRAAAARTNAKEHYDDFREDPREKTKAGAKSITELFRRYGPVFVGTYGTIYLATLGVLFAGVQTGTLDPVSLFTYIGGSDAESKDTVELVVEFMREHTLTKPYANYVHNNPNYANLAVAWVATKVTEPLRLPLAASITPRVARHFGYVESSSASSTSTTAKDEVAPRSAAESNS